MRNRLAFICWIIFVIACVYLVILLEILTPNDWSITVTQFLVIAKMISGTIMYKGSSFNKNNKS